MSLLDILSHYPNSSDQRVVWYQTLTAALNAQNAHQLQFDNIQVMHILNTALSLLILATSLADLPTNNSPQCSVVRQLYNTHNTAHTKSI